ncbi:MAG: ABC transporter permease [Candidatus Xenobia bacterium]
MNRKFAPYLLLLPMGLYMVCFYLLPLFMVAMDSFATRGAQGVLHYGFSLQAYHEVLVPKYGRVFARSVGYAATCTLICFLLGYPLAWFIAVFGQRRKNFLLLLIMLPFWTSYLIRTYAWIVILRDRGVINELLMKFGWLHEPLQMLNTPFSVVLGLVYGFLPFMTLPMYVSLEKLDRSLVEAAADLGATPWQIFTHVVFPLSLPGVIAGSILTFIPAVGDFVTPELLGGPQTEMIGKVIMTQFLVADNWPLGSALSFVLLVAMMAAILLYSRGQEA